MQNRGILIADAHIKQRLWTNFPKIQGDSYEALKKVQEGANGGFVISCGDLFDSNRPSSTDLKAVSDLMRNIETLYYVNGNHDSVVPDIVSSLGTNTVHLSTEPTYIGDVAFFGIDWRNNKEDILYLLKEVSNQMSRDMGIENVLIMHQSLDVFFMSHIITLEEIKQILDHSCNIFIGDIHVHKTVSSKLYSCTSPGPLVPQDIQQAKHQQYMIEVCCKEGDLEIRDIPVKVRDYVFLDSPDTLEETVKESLEKNTHNLPPVVFVKAPPGYKIPRELSNRDDIIVVANTLPEELHKETQETQTAIGTLLDAVREEIRETEPELAWTMEPLVQRLYNQETPDEFLLALLKKWGIIMT